ncbi:nuclear transport factor 2 family protein [Microvirga sp. BT689]|uniref:nuclear transport factor 2 family protein n=1 Tax=Microvirga arvi TaxID=2778731 RepID=UPI00195164F4|nr:nuclear transport factor 2 family protein [Microvirga arvi]MBM6583143.1 nuclear transport factor 2 family protein [Microvirga arvi]
MHSHALLLDKLYTSLNKKDHLAMAECYDKDAEFTDIAFNLRGENKIRAMWHMICLTDLKATFEILVVDDQTGTGDLVDEYTFGDTGRRVHNVIRSNFRFQNGLLVQHHDKCSALKWGLQALGPVKGVTAWLIPSIRRASADRKINAFIEEHPEYR